MKAVLRILGLLFCIAISTALVYALFAFFTFKINLAEWDVLSRFFYLIIQLIAWVLALFAWVESITKK